MEFVIPNRKSGVVWYACGKKERESEIKRNKEGERERKRERVKETVGAEPKKEASER